jgi:hypothetical protein
MKNKIKQKDKPILRIGLKTPFLSRKWRGYDQSDDMKGGNIKYSYLSKIIGY